MANKMSLSEVFDAAPQSQQGAAVLGSAPAHAARRLALDELAQSFEPPKPPDPTKGMSTAELTAAKAGMNATDLGQGYMQLLLAKPNLLAHIAPQFTAQKRAELEAKIAERKATDAPLRANADTASNVLSGVISPEAVAGVLSGGASIPVQAAVQAAMGATHAAGSNEERLQNAVSAGTGSVLGNTATRGVGKVANAARGNWADPSKKALADLGESRGVQLDAGDLGSGGARMAEDFLGKVPFTGRQGKLQRQGTQLSQMLQGEAERLAPTSMKTGQYQDGQEGHLLADQLLNAYDQKKTANNMAYKALDIFLNATGGIIPPVRPNNLVTQLGPFMNKYGKQISGMTNEDAARKLTAMAAQPSAAIQAGTSFSDLQDLQSALGDLVGQAKRQAASGNASRDLSGAVQQLYKAAQDDIDNWGQVATTMGKTNPATAGMVGKALNLYRAASADFKTNVLPYRQTPVVKDLINDSVPDKQNGGWLQYGVDPNMLMRSVIKPGQNQLLRNVYDLAPPEGQQALKYSLFKMQSDPTFNPDTGDVRPMAFQAKNKLLRPAGEAIMDPTEQQRMRDTMDVLGAADRAKVNIDDPQLNAMGAYIGLRAATTSPVGVLAALGGANAASTGLASKGGRNLIMAASKPFTGTGPVTGPLSTVANALPGYLAAQGVRNSTYDFVQPQQP